MLSYIFPYVVKYNFDLCSLENFQARAGSSSLLVLKREGQRSQMTSRECVLCLCKVNNGKVGIAPFYVKKSGEQHSASARMKAPMSREIKPFPVKASGQKYHRAGLSQGYTV